MELNTAIAYFYYVIYSMKLLALSLHFLLGNCQVMWRKSLCPEVQSAAYLTKTNVSPGLSCLESLCTGVSIFIFGSSQKSYGTIYGWKNFFFNLTLVKDCSELPQSPKSGQERSPSQNSTNARLICDSYPYSICSCGLDLPEEKKMTILL